jgi:exosortase A-associated hydrolase 1
MRFDYRGMGDSEGNSRTFEEIQVDLRCAIDTLFVQVPELEDVVLWGLCDAASATLFYAHTDQRVSGLVLVNPWVRTKESMARTYLRYYYLKRALDSSFWCRLFRGRVDLLGMMQTLLSMITVRAGTMKNSKEHPDGVYASKEYDGKALRMTPLPLRMLEGMKNFQGRLLFILSGADLTASEFKDLIADSPQWQEVMRHSRVTRHDLPGANHTFSRTEWRERVLAWTGQWIKSW